MESGNCIIAANCRNVSECMRPPQGFSAGCVGPQSIAGLELQGAPLLGNGQVRVNFRLVELHKPVAVGISFGLKTPSAVGLVAR